MRYFETRLKGGHPNSLGNTIEIVEEVLANEALFDELFNCYFSHDEVVRLRTSNAMKRICNANKSILLPYIDRFLAEVARIDQPSAQWTLAQLFLLVEDELDGGQKERAKDIMKQNIAHHTDWIVLNQTMTTLGKWARSDSALKKWMLPHLERLAKDNRKSVSKGAKKMMLKLNR